MTHKDFVLIAGALAAARLRINSVPSGEGYDVTTWHLAMNTAIEHLANALKTTNERFDYGRFVAAANGTPTTGRDKVKKS